MIKDHRSSYLRSFAFAFLAWITPLAASAATVRGTTGAFAVWITAPEAAPKPATVDVHNKNRTFDPAAIVISQGSTVRFPNDDNFYHSIYSDGNVDPFDIGFYGPGPGKTVDFPKAGIVELHCHVHAYMHGTIIVADGPYALASNGSYEIDNVPPGKHTLHTWVPLIGEKTYSVIVPTATSSVTFDDR